MSYQLTKYASMSPEGPRMRTCQFNEDEVFATTIEFEDNTLTMKHVTQNIIDAYDFYQHQGLEVLSIFGGYIQRLSVPDGVEYVYCCKCGLREIQLPDSAKLLVCDDNYLDYLELPASIEVVEANNNCIRKVTFRGDPVNL